MRFLEFCPINSSFIISNLRCCFFVCQWDFCGALWSMGKLGTFDFKNNSFFVGLLYGLSNVDHTTNSICCYSLMDIGFL